MKKRISIVNGPNLNLVGSREPDIYGARSLTEYLPELETQFPEISFTFYQSNIEGELINFLQECREDSDGVILNAGAYAHTSIAIADAVASIDVPVVEVHISNVYAREDYRKHSFVAAKCMGSISGLGLKGYALAVHYYLD